MPIFGQIFDKNFHYILHLENLQKLFLVANFSDPNQKNVVKKYKEEILDLYNANKDIYNNYIFGYVNSNKCKFMLTLPQKTPYFTSVILDKYK